MVKHWLIFCEGHTQLSLKTLLCFSHFLSSTLHLCGRKKEIKRCSTVSIYDVLLYSWHTVLCKLKQISNKTILIHRQSYYKQKFASIYTTQPSKFASYRNQATFLNFSKFMFLKIPSNQWTLYFACRFFSFAQLVNQLVNNDFHHLFLDHMVGMKCHLYIVLWSCVLSLKFLIWLLLIRKHQIF